MNEDAYRAILRRLGVEPLSGETSHQERAAPPGIPYAFPWPDALSSLGGRHVGPFTSCEACGRGTWVRYGTTPRCLDCARAESEP